MGTIRDDEALTNLLDVARKIIRHHDEEVAMLVAGEEVLTSALDVFSEDLRGAIEQVDEAQNSAVQSSVEGAPSASHDGESLPKHTPLPWKADKNLGCKSIKGGKRNPLSRQSPYKQVAYTVGLSNEEEDAANAQLIVKACNSHYKLLEACRLAIRLRTLENLVVSSRSADQPASKRELRSWRRESEGIITKIFAAIDGAEPSPKR